MAQVGKCLLLGVKMSDKKFKIGDRVASIEDVNMNKVSKYYYDESYCFGIVSDMTAKGDCIVTWDDKWKNSGKPQIIEEVNLAPEKEFKDSISKLEKEYEKLQTQIGSKLNGISKIVEDARNLAKKNGYDLSDFSAIEDTFYPLMRSFGWSTSSLTC